MERFWMTDRDRGLLRATSVRPKLTDEARPHAREGKNREKGNRHEEIHRLGSVVRGGRA